MSSVSLSFIKQFLTGREFVIFANRVENNFVVQAKVNIATCAINIKLIVTYGLQYSNLSIQS